MNETVYLAPTQAHSENVQQPLTSSYSPIHLQGISDLNTYKQVPNEDFDETDSVVTNEPSSKPIDKPWPSLAVSGRYHTTNDSSLVLLESDSDNETFPTLARATTKYQANQQLTLQLAKDGYELDQVPDNEQIDLVPPSSTSIQACACCKISDTSCIIS